MILEILASVSGFLMSIAGFPQAYKIFKTKNSENVSLITYAIFLIGGIIWVIYGLTIKNIPIILGYSPGVIGSSLVILGMLRYKRR